MLGPLEPHHRLCDKSYMLGELDEHVGNVTLNGTYKDGFAVFRSHLWTWSFGAEGLQVCFVDVAQVVPCFEGSSVHPFLAHSAVTTHARTAPTLFAPSLHMFCCRA